jgi:hypothetical protein
MTQTRKTSQSVVRDWGRMETKMETQKKEKAMLITLISVCPEEFLVEINMKHP